ncbi:MAG: hypothetical protein J5817_10785 [Treponema sp.]|nr:hypothetical protein [Treponema sp.]
MEDEFRARIGYSLYQGSAGRYAIIMIDHIRVADFISEDTSTNPATARFWLKADAGYYIAGTNPIMACALPSGINGNNLVVDETTNCWTFRE